MNQRARRRTRHWGLRDIGWLDQRSLVNCPTPESRSCHKFFPGSSNPIPSLSGSVAAHVSCSHSLLARIYWNLGSKLELTSMGMVSGLLSHSLSVRGYPPAQSPHQLNNTESQNTTQSNRSKRINDEFKRGPTPTRQQNHKSERVRPEASHPLR